MGPTEDESEIIFFFFAGHFFSICGPLIKLWKLGGQPMAMHAACYLSSFFRSHIYCTLETYRDILSI